MLRSHSILRAALFPAALSFTAFCLMAASAPSAHASFEETVLHSFSGAPSDGAAPDCSLTRVSDNLYYGTTFNGGSASKGTLFKMDGSGNVSILHSFGDGSVANDGTYPEAGVLVGSDGSLYGTTVFGGSGTQNYTTGCGTVYKLSPSGTFTLLHSFTDGSDGGEPEAGLTFGSDGRLYGTTTDLDDEEGTVFSLNTDGSNYLVQFLFDSTKSGADGDEPFGTLTLAPGAGNMLYGTTSEAGPNNYGAVFSLTPGTTTNGASLSVVYAFGSNGNSSDGYDPLTGALVVDPGGNVYGTTFEGGDYDYGTVFKIVPGGTETILHSFNPKGTDGEGGLPRGGLLLATDGNLYGTAVIGGNFGGQGTAAPDGDGTLYSIAPDGSNYDSAVYQFEGADYQSDGSAPLAAPVEDGNGNLFGTTSEGGGTATSSNPGDGTLYIYEAGLPTPIYLSSVSFYSSSVAGGTGTTGVIVFSQAAKSSGTVMLSSSNPGAASVPSSVPVSAGQSSVTFPVTSTTVTSEKAVTITAASNIAPNVSATLDVVPGLKSVTLSPASVQGGTAATTANRVYFTGNAATNTAVTLTSSNTSVATVPSQTAVQAGYSSHTFTITTKAVTTTQTVTITATANGVTQTATLTVTPPPSSLKSVTLSPSSTKGGTSTTANRVYWSGNAPASETVTLTSSNPAVAAVPSSVTIQPGYSSHTFTITTKAVTSTQTVIITAKASSGASQTATLTVTP